MTQTRAAGRNHQNDNPTTDRLAAMAHDTVDRVAEVANEAEQQVRGAAARTAKQAKQMQDEALEAAGENVTKIRSYVKANPFTSAGIAFAVGIVLSTLIRR